MKKGFDTPLFLATIFLIGLGIIMVYSSSAILAQERYHQTYFFLKKEIVFVLIGFAGLFLAKEIPFSWLKKIIYPLFFIELILLLLVFVPGIGVKAGGATRWISLVLFKFQPSEAAKLVLILYLAYALAKKKDKIRSFLVGFVPPMALSGVLIALVLLENDLGNAMLMVATVFALFFLAGARLSYLLTEILLCIPTFYILIASVGYRRRRLLAFLNPWEYRDGSGFQLIQSFIAFQTGGFWGQGLGEGKQKLFYLPEAHTDFIFSVVGEELGFLGVAAIIFLFGFFLYRTFLISMRAKDLFSTYLAGGIAFLLSFQILFNMSVVLGLVPTKGITLPFISYGGSSLVMSMIMVGLLLNISSQEEETVRVRQK
ncbi:MAG: putative lipid II flippase FtsW [bacterium]|nr:putative lipid II flippase FtsW [bacterium]